MAVGVVSPFHRQIGKGRGMDCPSGSAVPELEAAREGIAEYGRIRAERDGRKLAPEDWMNEHYTMMGGVFETEISDTEEYCEMKMHYCPLLEEWKKMGLSPEDQDLFCDVAMELDRNRAKEHGIPCDIVERLGKGDPFCRVVLWKKKKD